MKEDVILITQKDYVRLKAWLLKKPPPRFEENFENLELELDRATIIFDNEVPKGLVTMNSTVRFINLSTGKEQVLELAYPDRADLSQGRISVLAPLGSALIGLSVGQEINWKFPDNSTNRIKILEVIYQPEANGHWHL